MSVKDTKSGPGRTKLAGEGKYIYQGLWWPVVPNVTYLNLH